MNWNQLSCNIFLIRSDYVWSWSLGNYTDPAKGIKSFRQGLKDDKKEK